MTEPRPPISRRAGDLPDSTVRLLQADADAAKERGIHIYHLNIGQPDIETPKCILDRAATALDPVVEYAPANGTPGAIRTMLRYYADFGIAISKDNLIITSGGSEALLFAMIAIADDGDDALVVEPLYSNWRHFSAMAGINLRPLRTFVEDGFRLPGRAAWEAALTPRTRFVLLCNPNNPTGTVYTPDEVREIAELCRDHGIYLVVDEVYREFVYHGRKPWSALLLEGFDDTIIVTDSISKRYSACGLRIGCLVTRNAKVFDAASRMAEGRLSGSAIAQKMLEGLENLSPDYITNVIAEYDRRRQVLWHGLRGILGIELQQPEGAFYFVPRLPVDAVEFSRWLLTDFQLDGATVMLTPAGGFYLTPGLGHDEVRIAYVLNETDLHASVRILGAALEEYQKTRTGKEVEAEV
jgi:aspartate aminotransferase